MDAAIAAVKGAHTGHIESEFTLEAEIDNAQLVLSISIAGVFRTPDSAHLSVTYSIEGPPRVDSDGAEIDIGVQSWTEEWIIVGDDVYVLSSLRGDYRHSRESIELPFDLSDLFRFDMLDPDGEISTDEQELDGVRVYYVTGPAAQGRRYPLLDRAPGIDGVVDYWIGAEDHLLRRLEISVVSVGLTRDAGTQRLNGFVTLSDFGRTVDISPPAPEGADDHSNSPASATEISVGESLTASVDSWVDSDYFRFQAEEGRLYHIVVSDDRGYNKAYGTHSTLFGPDGVTPERTFSQSSGQLGARIVWQAPASDSYYLRVESGQQEVEVYTLTITLLPEEDDYGNDPSTAHEIGIGEFVEGLIGQLDDRDYFKFTANEGRVYRIDVHSQLQQNRPDVVLHGPGGTLQEARSFSSRGSDTERILWSATSQGDYYVSVEFRHRNLVGSYTLRVDAIAGMVDDHSDGASNATVLSIGETVSGDLDYEFDLDYFKFSAEEGQGYRVNIDYGGWLNHSNPSLYASDGFTPEPLDKYTYEDRDGYRLVWMAPESGTYHLEVKSFLGATGEYTITVTAVEAGPDDHGDDAETATDISIGETVQGFMDNEFDLDYFRFTAVEGQEYLIQVDYETIGHPRVKFYAADGTESSPYSSSSGLNSGATYRWIADTSSDYFVELDSRSGNLGAYTIVIDALD